MIATVAVGALAAAPLAVAQAAEPAKSDQASTDVSVTARPAFKLPFPGGQVWSGQTRTNHSPRLSIDFNRTNDDGDPVVASAPGTVSVVRDLGGSSYGKYVVVDHGGGWQSLYAHLKSFSVSVGQSVNYGTKIGAVGTTGGSTGPHLHYEQKSGGSAVEIYFDGAKALYFGTKNYTSTNGAASNPYTPKEVCGANYTQINSATLTADGKTVGRVYLMYYNGKNCVVTLKLSNLGKATATSAYLEPQGGTRGTDSGNFTYYAGPVVKSAAATCVKWGGSVGGASFNSPWQHCG
ncbi:Spore-associated protein A [Stackebrandtia soli]